MKILLSSHFFYPSVGGIETSSMLYAREFAKLGHEVLVITKTASQGEVAALPFRVLRNPGIWELLKACAWCDVFIHNNISLQVAWPLLFLKRPWCIIHQTWLGDGSLRSGIIEPIKRIACRFAYNKVLSHAMKRELAVPTEVIGNPYDDEVFLRDESASRKGMVFVGRLVSDKGVDVAIQALERLSSILPELTLDIIGDGEERAALEGLASKLKIDQKIRFLGQKKGRDLSRQLNNYEIALIPSRWDEPFGIVALEALACGCVAIASEGGGLPEAVGKCGLLFENGNSEDLARKILGLYKNPQSMESLRINIPKHLEKFRPSKMASEIVESFKREWGTQ